MFATTIGVIIVIGVVCPLVSIHIVHSVTPACIIVLITVLVILGLALIDQQF